MSTGNYSHVTRAAGTILTALIYNTDHQNHVLNQNPLMTGAYSDTVSQFQLCVNPGEIGSENIPTSLAGEIERLRFQIRAITGESQWNAPPSSNLKGVAGTPDGGVPLQKLAYTSQGNIMLRKSTGTGAWESSQIKDLDPMTPAAGDWIIGQAAAGGAPRKIDARAVAGGAGVVAPQGRLSNINLAYALPNQVNMNTVWYVPHQGLLVPCWNGLGLVAQNMGGPLQQLTTDNTKSPGPCAANTLYDIFFWMDGTTPRISRGYGWTGSRSGLSVLGQVGGIFVNNSPITNGPAGFFGTYLGTIFTNGAALIDFVTIGGQEQGRPAWVGFYNYYHRTKVSFLVRDLTAKWVTPFSGSFITANNSANNSIRFCSGQEQDIDATYTAAATGHVGGDGLFGGYVQIAIGLDFTQSILGAVAGGLTTNAQAMTANFKYIFGASGAHSLVMMDRTVPGLSDGPGAIAGQFNGYPTCAMVGSLWY